MYSISTLGKLLLNSKKKAAQVSKLINILQAKTSSVGFPYCLIFDNTTKTIFSSWKNGAIFAFSGN